MLNEDVVRKVIARWSGLSLEECQLDTRMRDIGVDSLLIASIVAELEAAMARPLQDDAVSQLFIAERIGDVVAVLRGRAPPVHSSLPFNYGYD